MTNRADIWLGSNETLGQSGNAEERSFDTARRITSRPFVVILTRRNPDTGILFELPPQSIRIEAIQSIRSAGEQRNTQVEVSKQYVVLIGLYNHPTLPNFNVLRGDWFMFRQRRYEIIEIDDTVPGRLLASGELTP